MDSDTTIRQALHIIRDTHTYTIKTQDATLTLLELIEEDDEP
jgi:hypothetical protein